MIEVSYAFILAGTVISSGFFASIFFEKTKIPDVLALLAIGIILGPASLAPRQNRFSADRF